MRFNLTCSAIEIVELLEISHFAEDCATTLELERPQPPRLELERVTVLELDLPTTLDLLLRAEIAFSPSSRFDLIVTYLITNKIYDIYKINTALFKYGQPILGE